MNEWLLPIGLTLYGLGAFVQIVEEWEARGLTDTSFKALFLLCLGPALIAYYALRIDQPFITITTILPSLAAGLLFITKLVDVVKSKILRRTQLRLKELFRQIKNRGI